MSHLFATSSTPFSLATLKQKTEETEAAAVEYIQMFFIKTCTPSLGAWMWNPDTKNMNFVDRTNMDAYMPPDLQRMEIAGKKVAVSWEAKKWFFSSNNFILCKTNVNPTQPAVFEKNGQLYVNLAERLNFDYAKLQPFDSYPAEAKAAALVIVSHLKEVWSSDKEDHFKYLTCWFGCVIAGRRNDSLLYAKETIGGAGKSIFLDWFASKVVGRSAHNADSLDTVLGEFNSVLQGKTLCLLDEPPTASPHQWNSLYDAIKAKITADWLEIKKKYADSFNTTNYVSWVMSTNNNSVKLPDNDRRFFLCDISQKYIGNKSYFNRYNKARNTEGCAECFAAYLKEFLTKYGDDYAANSIPKSKTRDEILTESLHPVYKLIKEYWLAHGNGFDLPFATLYNEISRLMADHYGNSKKGGLISKQALSQKLSALKSVRKGEGQSPYRKRSTPTRQPAIWVYASFEDLRREFADRGWISEYDEINPSLNHSVSDLETIKERKPIQDEINKIMGEIENPQEEHAHFDDNARPANDARIVGEIGDADTSGPEQDPEPEQEHEPEKYREGKEYDGLNFTL